MFAVDSKIISVFILNHVYKSKALLSEMSMRQYAFIKIRPLWLAQNTEEQLYLKY